MWKADTSEGPMNGGGGCDFRARIGTGICICIGIGIDAIEVPDDSGIGAGNCTGERGCSVGEGGSGGDGTRGRCHCDWLVDLL